ncbi:MFS transporter [Microbacterium sp. MYb64]|nr:MFS transporter [Microbacterium sp. MYb64]
MASTLFPTIAKALDLNNGHLGILAAAGKIVAVPLGPVWVAVSNRVPRRTIMVVSTALAGVFGLLAGFAESFEMLLLFNTLMAATLVGIGPIANSVISDSFDDAHRARAVGIYFGVAGVLSSLLGPVVGQLSRFDSGWRWGLWGMSAICILSSIGILVVFKDPGVGAAEKQLVDLDESDRRGGAQSFREAVSVVKVPTFAVMLLSRLLSGHMLFLVFGVQFLVTERGFSNAVAAIAIVPYGLGFFLGTVGGGLLVSWIDRKLPLRGRVLLLQLAQVCFATAALLGTQHAFEHFWVYLICWGAIGLSQGLNPTINRPIIMASIMPESRAPALAVLMTIVEPLAWVIYALGAGALANVLGLQTVFFFVLVVMILINAVVLSALYVTYPRDVHKVEHALDARRREALS